MDDSQDNPQSLFEGGKGVKVVKLAISTVLCAISTPCQESAEMVKLCGVALTAISAGTLRDWVGQRGSMHQLMKLRERMEEDLEVEMLQAVRFLPCWLTEVFQIPFCLAWQTARDRRWVSGHFNKSDRIFF